MIHLSRERISEVIKGQRLSRNPKTGNLSCRGALCLSPQRFFKQRITFLDEHAQRSGNSPAIEGSSEAGGTGGCDYDRAAAPLPVGWLLLRKLDRRLLLVFHFWTRAIKTPFTPVFSSCGSATSLGRTCACPSFPFWATIVGGFGFGNGIALPAATMSSSRGSSIANRPCCRMRPAIRPAASPAPK